MPEVLLLPIDCDVVLERLLEVAVADADPGEVMPPVAGPPGWTPERRSAFRDFHRQRYDGIGGPARTAMFAVSVDGPADTADDTADGTADGSVVGMIRMTLLDEPGIAEIGVWLGRRSRGRGVGTAALRALLEQARLAGVRTIVADTTAANTAALRILEHCGADLTRHEPASSRVDAVLHVQPPPPRWITGPWSRQRLVPRPLARDHRGGGAVSVR